MKASEKGIKFIDLLAKVKNEIEAQLKQGKTHKDILTEYVERIQGKKPRENNTRRSNER